MCRFTVAGKNRPLGAGPGVPLAPDAQRSDVDEGHLGIAVVAGGHRGQEVIELLQEDRIVEVRLPERPARLDALAGPEVVALGPGLADPPGRGPTRPGFAAGDAEGHLLALGDPALGGRIEDRPVEPPFFAARCTTTGCGDRSPSGPANRPGCRTGRASSRSAQAGCRSSEAPSPCRDWPARPPLSPGRTVTRSSAATRSAGRQPVRAQTIKTKPAAHGHPACHVGCRRGIRHAEDVHVCYSCSFPEDRYRLRLDGFLRLYTPRRPT